ncbi:unnamed protein product [Leptidea sinapis]|uniref:Immunoglobulin I-set domain-containing protein n=1 Tax=Leptidea sinapis TaxID=189913 RepID=A0A5E4QQU6_9NEOP|nr:unnamed protein product [Leptidea sinapis]
MNLTIKSLAIGDFGTYVCAAVNALGKTESQVSLHNYKETGLPIIPIGSVSSDLFYNNMI